MPAWEEKQAPKGEEDLVYSVPWLVELRCLESEAVLDANASSDFYRSEVVEQ